MRYTRALLLDAVDADCTGRWRPSQILTTMQSCATAHSEALGCGRDMMLAHDMIWVLSRTHLHMDAYPMMDEPVVAHTWPGVSNRFFFPRYHVFERPDGAPLGAAVSLWLVIDVKARKVIPTAKVPFVMPDTSGLPAPLPLPDRVARLEAAAAPTLRRPVFSDLDVNGHVNNTRYADWVCDALPLALLRTHALRDLLLNYTKEIWPEQPVRCTLALDGENFSLLGEAPDEDQIYFEAGGTLMPWHSDRRV